MKLKCQAPECDKTVENERWAKGAAHKAGWIFLKNGTQFCPDHQPDWVEKWRDKQKVKKQNETMTIGDILILLQLLVETDSDNQFAKAEYTPNDDGTVTIKLFPLSQEKTDD